MNQYASRLITLLSLVFLVAFVPAVAGQLGRSKVVPDFDKREYLREESAKARPQATDIRLKARQQIYYQQGSVAKDQLAQLLYATPGYYPCGYVYTAELRPLSGDPDLYLHERVSGVWRQLKKSINGAGALDSFTFTCSDITSSATNVDLDVKGYSPGISTYEFFLYKEATTSSGFSLRFPVEGYNAYNAPISAVFDHSAPSSTTGPKNGVVVAYTGETGSYAPHPNDPTCISQGGPAFTINDHYFGASSCGGQYYLAYDGHNGIDYKFNSGTPVFSTADGTITVSDCAKRSTGISCSGRGTGYGKLTISHGTTGYSTIYLHLSYMADSVSLNTWYPKGTLVGYSGSTNAGSAHLHVSVNKSGVYVDPYGWTGGYTDPYPGLNGGVQNTKLWE
jgi:murein DD-endopeptidase MepM/ murein hydrolase activator NlpD